MRILLGIDEEFSPLTQYALRTMGELLEHIYPQARLILLNVIPMAQVVTSHPGLYAGQVLSLDPSAWQREQAEEVLFQARSLLRQYDIPPERCEVMVRVGTPAEEIVRMAKELQVHVIVVGSHYDSWSRRLRRFFSGSVSRRVLHLASCPVLLAIPPRSVQPKDLVVWYSQALKSYLGESSVSLQVLTPQKVAQQFLPPDKNKAGRKELAAATLALEQLVSDGALCRHYVKGEVRYVND